MSRVTERLAAAGLALPEAPSTLGAYCPASRAAGLVFTAGQLPIEAGALVSSGLVGGEVTLDTARSCAERAALNALAAASGVCDLDSVESVVRLTVYVASAPGFTEQPKVADAASEVLTAAFGKDAGRHSREAVGVAVLPLGAPVELSLVLSVG